MVSKVMHKVLRKKDLFFLCWVLIFTFFSVGIYSQEEETGLIREETQVSQENTTGSEKDPDSGQADNSEDDSKLDNISLDLKGVNIVELFRILSLKTGKTIVPSKSVQGRINIFLNSVSFKDALDIVLITQDLASVIKGDVIYIMTQQEYKSRYGKTYGGEREYRSIKLNYANPDDVFNIISELKSDIGKVIVDQPSGTVILLDIPEKIKVMQDAVAQLDAPLETKTFVLNYADPENVKSQLEDGVVSDVGGVIVEERSSKIIVSDLPSRMDNISKVVRDLDEPDKQVFIEAEIVEITLSKQFYRGIDWEKVFDTKAWDGLDFKGYFPVLPAPGRYGQVSVGTFSSDKYNMVFQFLEDFGDLKILSRPKIAVVNNEEANILVGTKEVYVTQTTSQASDSTVTSESVEFIDVGVKLNVIPTIHDDGFISIEVKPEVSTVTDTVTTSLGSRIPIVASSEAETKVKVKDGTMIMIGGLIKQTKDIDKTGIPGLSSLPFIGSLFGTRSVDNQTTELVIFISPHIITGEAPLEGTEPKYKIPADVMPEDIKKKIFLKEIEKIHNDSAKKSQDKDAVEKEKEGSVDIKGIKE